MMPSAKSFACCCAGDRGTFVGNVKNLILDLPHRRIDGILIGRTNPTLVEDGRSTLSGADGSFAFYDVVVESYQPGYLASLGLKPGQKIQVILYGTRIELIPVQPIKEVPGISATEVRRRMAAG